MTPVDEIIRIILATGIVLGFYNLAQGIIAGKIYEQTFGVASFSAGIYLWFDYLQFSGYPMDGGWYYHLAAAAIFAVGPSIYILTRLPLRQPGDTLKQYYLHYIPAVLAVIIPAVLQLAGHDLSYHPYLFFETTVIQPMDVVFGTALGFNALYDIVIFRDGRYVVSVLSQKSKDAVVFAIGLVSCATLICAIAVLGIALQEMSIFRTATVLTSLTFFIASLFIRNNPQIFEPIEEAIREVAYKTSTLDKLQIDKIQTGLRELFEEKQVHLDPELTQRDLAAKLGIKHYQLSEVLNVHFKTNFSTLVNKYRIVDSLVFLQEDNIKALNIAFKVGFNSKATFHRAFKKIMGCTPGEYNENPDGYTSPLPSL